VIHVLSDSARARILQPASLKFDFSRISSFVSVRSLLSMRLSSCGGRSGCASVALLLSPADKPKLPVAAAAPGARAATDDDAAGGGGLGRARHT
jgi:hypothetical protein